MYSELLNIQNLIIYILIYNALRNHVRCQWVRPYISPIVNKEPTSGPPKTYGEDVL